MPWHLPAPMKLSYRLRLQLRLHLASTFCNIKDYNVPVTTSVIENSGYKIKFPKVDKQQSNIPVATI